MKRTAATIFLICLLFSCNRVTESLLDGPIPINQPPVEVVAKLQKGYDANQLTGQLIEPVITSNGKSIVTGNPIAAEIRSSQIRPGDIERTTLKPRPIHGNILKSDRQISGRLAKAKIIRSGQKIRLDSTFRLINSIGEVIPTNIPLPLKGAIIPCIHPQPTEIQPPRFNNNAISDIQFIDVFQGLTSSQILSLIQDRQENIWIGTLGGGVSKYDGNVLINYTEREGLAHNRVWAILEDEDGNLWFGTGGGGLCMFDGHEFTSFSEHEGLSENNVTVIMQDQKGNIWFNSGDRGVNKFDGKYITHFSTKEGLPSNTIVCIHEDSKGHIWFGTTEGLSKYDGQSFTQIREEDGLAGNLIRSVVEDSKGNIWIGTETGLSKFDGSIITTYREENGLPHSNIRTLYIDSDDALWIGSFGGGVCRLTGQTIHHVSSEMGLSDDRVSAILQDKAENMWFGTRGGGLNRYNAKSFNYNSKTDLIFKNNVTAILHQGDKNYWFGTHGSGIFRANGQSITQYNTQSGLPVNEVRAMLADHLGNIWIGMNGGHVCKLYGNNYTQISRIPGVPKYNIWSLFEDQAGTIWVGTDGGGIVRLKSVQSGDEAYEISILNDENGLSNNRIRTIIEDRHGNIWIGSGGGGLSQFDGQAFTHYSEREGLSSNIIWSLLESMDGDIWIGSNGTGLTRLRFDTNGEIGTFTHFTERNGLTSNRIRSLTEDAHQRLWVGTTYGLNQVFPTGISRENHLQNPSAVIYNYTSTEGLKSINFNRGSTLVDHNNYAWWGSGNNLVILDLNNQAVKSQPPDISLNQVHINDGKVDFRSNLRLQDEGFTCDSVMAFSNIPLGLVLDHKHNHLTFHFAGKDWHAPQKLQYSYKLQGLDEQWSNPSNEMKADYRNIPPGTYTFHVTAIGSAQIWSDHSQFSFRINPPWWSTWWARGLFLLIVMILIFSYVRLRTANLKARQRELEQMVNQRTREVVEQKDELAKKNKIITKEKERSDKLLLNILPSEIAEELKVHGDSPARAFKEVTVLFTDFKEFTIFSEQMSPSELVEEINICFKAFDEIVERHQIEKIKTIGDSYMAAGGLKLQEKTKVHDVINVALEMQLFMSSYNEARKKVAKPSLDMRCGIHTGPVVAGIVGIKKFQYDIWGDTVNLASRMESSGAIGKVNISQTTYNRTKGDHQFSYVSRGKLRAKNKGLIHMYFVEKA